MIDVLYVIRHGRTDWNIRLKMQGRTDIPLNEEGRKMAEEAAKEYRNVHFDICYCSPLTRARQTAEILLRGREVPVFYDDRLLEMAFGVYEGAQNVRQKPDHPMYLLFQDPLHYQPGEGGESFAELFSRTGSFLEEVVTPALREHKDVLIVGHGAMNTSIVCQVKGISLEHFWEAGFENCQLMKLL